MSRRLLKNDYFALRQDGARSESGVYIYSFGMSRLRYALHSYGGLATHSFSGGCVNREIKDTRLPAAALAKAGSRKNKSNQQFRILVSRLLLILLLSGCASGPDQEIEALVKHSRTQKTVEPTPIPEVTNNVSCLYQAAHLRNPFDWYDSAGSTHLSGEPDSRRPREPLEYYPLESLKMIGYLERNQIFWGLVKDKQGVIHKVFVGQAIGQNGGTIKQIHERGIEIEEGNTMNEKRQFTLPLSAG